MREFKRLLKQIITTGSGVSSKRVCGLIGWLVLLVCLGYATWNGTELPLVTPDFIFGTIVLLGVDSVTAIWKKFPTESGPGKRKHPIEDDHAAGCNQDDLEPEPGSLNNAEL